MNDNRCTVPSLTTAYKVKDNRLTWIHGGEIKKDKSNESPLNSAFVFIKPHANNEKIQSYVKSKLLEHGISIISEFDISGSDMDEKKLIDRHYYAIASKATILEPHQMNVPESKFEVCSHLFVSKHENYILVYSFIDSCFERLLI